ncbi:MAG: UDP-glucose/GDP-mannose dehydrogenase family protein, partial [Pseudomonadota bacterium]
SAKRIFPEGYFSSGKLSIVDNQYAVLEGAEILVILTEWKSFLYPDLALIKEKLKQKVIIDGRNIYDPEEMRREGFLYSGIGRGASLV